MRRLLQFLMIYGIFAVLVGLGAHFYGGPKLKKFLEQKGSEKLAGTLSIEKLEFSLWPPLGATLKNVTFKKEISTSNSTGVGATISPRRQFETKLGSVLFRLKLSPSLLQKRIQLELFIKHANVDVILPTTTEEATPSPTSPQPAEGINFQLASQSHIDLSISVADTHIKIHGKDRNVGGLVSNLNLSLNNVDRTIKLDQNGEIMLDLMSRKVNLPVSLKALALWDEPHQTLRLNNFDGKIAFLTIHGAGQTELPTLKHSYSFKLQTDKITSDNFVSISKLVPEIPFGEWGGQMNGSIDIKKSALEPFSGTGNFKISQFSWTGNWANDNFRFVGPVKFDAETTFNLGPQEVTSQFSYKVDLTPAQITSDPYFTKSAQTRLFHNGQGRFQGGIIYFDNLDFVLDSVKMGGQGTLGSDLQKIVNFQVSLPRTELQGLERLIPAMSSVPLRGTIDLNAKLSGPLTDPEKITLRVDPLKMNNVSGMIKWAKDGNSLQGPVQIHGVVNLDARGTQLLQTNIDADSTLPQLSVKFGATDQKATNFPMSFHGTASAKINVRGRYQFASGIKNSPLRVTGTLKAQIPELIYATPKTSIEPQTAKTIPKPTAAFPDWPLFNNSSISQEISIDQVTWNSLLIKGVRWQGRIQNGTLSGHSNAAKVLGGNLQTSLSVDLRQTHPTIHLRPKIQAVSVEESLIAFFPDWKELARGTASGTLNLEIPHPSRTDFLEATKAQGDLLIANGTLRSLPLQKMVLEKLARFSGAQAFLSTDGINSMSSLNPTALVTSSIATKLEWVGKRLNLINFRAIGVDQSQLEGDGWIQPDKTFYLGGQVAVSNPPIQGDFLRANADAKGRLVIPLKIQGNIFKPEIEILDTTLRKMVTKAVEHQAGKAKAQLEQRAREEAQKQIDSAKKNLETEAKKLLQGVFK